jgi:Ribbon-helix-helix domain
MSRKKISTTIYVTPEQSDKLRLLHERTKVPVAVYIREGIDLVLRHYTHLLPGQLPLDARGDARAESRNADARSEARTPKENGSTRSLDRAAAAEKSNGASHDKAVGSHDKTDKDRDDDSVDSLTGKPHGKKHGAANRA